MHDPHGWTGDGELRTMALQHIIRPLPSGPKRQICILRADNTARYEIPHRYPCAAFGRRSCARSVTRAETVSTDPEAEKACRREEATQQTL